MAEANKIYNVVAGKNPKGLTSNLQGFYGNFHFLKSNTWANTRTGGPNTVDFKKGVFFESNSQNMRNAIKNSQIRKDQTERQIRFNNVESMVTGGGSGSSNPVAHGKKHTQDYYKLKEGLQSQVNALTSTDIQIIMLGVIALILFLKQ